jgi:hypothetical protein
MLAVERAPELVGTEPPIEDLDRVTGGSAVVPIIPLAQKPAPQTIHFTTTPEGKVEELLTYELEKVGLSHYSMSGSAAVAV